MFICASFRRDPVLCRIQATDTQTNDMPMKRSKSKSRASGPPASNNPDGMLLSNTGNRQNTIRVSLENLKDPASKVSLRQHFTGAFPETHRVSFFAASESSDMGITDRLSRQASSLSVGVGQNEAAGFSTSSVNSTSADPKRLSTVPERDSQSQIDIQQAIHLLQELRKTASPQELVALHKALLPTRDSVIAGASTPVNEESPNVSPANLIRHRSMLPPGLATRASPTEDLLRRQEDVPVVKKSKRSKTNLHSALREATSKSDLAALDLANDAIIPRAATPSDHGETPLGVYRYGTLRITNGAASPVPSFASIRKSLELDIPPLPDLPERRYRNSTGQRASLDQRASQDFYTAPNTPQERSSMEFHNARTSSRERVSVFVDSLRSSWRTPTGMQSDGERRPRERSRKAKARSRSRDASISGIPMPSDVDESSPRIYRPSRPKRSRENSKNEVPQVREPAHSRDSSRSRIPLRMETSKQSLRVLGERVSVQSLTPVRPEIDDGRVSPIPSSSDLPRFAQRWSHRASKLTEDYNSDSDQASYGDITTLRQYEDRTSLLNTGLLKRLSTVVDGGEGDDENATARETPEAALSKLEGTKADQSTALTLETQIASLNERPSPSPRSGNSSSLDRPRLIQKADSGYGTDNSFQAPQPKQPLDQRRATILRLVPDEGVSLEEDGKSLYTFNQILKSPTLVDKFATPSATPSPPAEANNKKRPSLFRLSSSKKSTPTLVADPLSSDEVMVSSPMEIKGMKSKKLQKPMPESIRKERKAQLKKQRDRRSSEAPELAVSEVARETPLLPAELSARSHVSMTSHARFSFDPITSPTAIFDTTPARAGPNELQGDSRHLTAELNGDDGFASAEEGATAPKLSLFRSRSKRKSASNPRSISLQVPGSSKLSQAGNNIKRTSAPTSPKQALFGKGSISCITPDDSNNEVDIPLWTDHASISRTLGSSPYDQSTGLIRKTIAFPSAVMHQIQAPHEITTSLARSKTGGLKGMDSGMASELARMKSRDVAISNNEEVYERPRMAKPKTRRSKTTLESSSLTSLPTGDSFPSSDETKDTAATASLAELPARSNSIYSAYSESIPPMPELPADVQVKVSSMVQMAAKRKEVTHPASLPFPPTGFERPGDSTISVAEAIRNARRSRLPSEAEVDENGLKVPRTRPSGPRRRKSQRIERETSSSSSDQAFPTRQDVREVQKTDIQPSPTRDSEERELSGWEQQAKHWREQRASVRASLDQSRPFRGSALQTTTTTSTSSPTIIVSRYVTPHGAHPQSETSTATQTSTSTTTSMSTEVIRQRKDSASLQADAYRALIGENRTPTPNTEEQEEYFSYNAATTVTVQRLDQQRPATVIVTSPAHSPRPSQSGFSSPNLPISRHSPNSSTSAIASQFPTPPRTSIQRDRSPGGRVITPSGNYHPYTPADAAQAKHSRAESLARLTGAPVPAPTATTTKPQTPKSAPASSQKNAIEALFDRYSGGLEYGFERGAGIGGSAGTRATKDKASKKSKDLAESCGLDLSDVPVFLQKVA